MVLLTNVGLRPGPTQMEKRRPRLASAASCHSLYHCLLSHYLGRKFLAWSLLCRRSSKTWLSETLEGLVRQAWQWV